jgi:hypothetical protein
MLSSVWVFCAPEAIFPAGVFTEQQLADAWIKKHSLTGTLTEYPLNIGLYEWAISKGYFKPKYPSHHKAKFIGRFSSAYLEHYHYENGICEEKSDNPDDPSLPS